MPGVKSVILAGTINLENYENFRFEFAGEVDQPADVMKQAEFSASCLLGLANSADPATGQKIRNYVARVFGVREEAFQKGPRREDPAIYESKPVPSTPATPVPAAPPAPAPAPAKPAAPTVATCEKCGEGVTESQRKMSQLFASKTLCKKCLDGGAS